MKPSQTPHDERTLREFKRWGKELPEHIPHGTDDDIRSKLKPLLPHSWKLKGNVLIGQTEMGELVQKIPTSYILKGVDERGLPVFEKVLTSQ